jgi:hypothetical protein
MYKYVYTYIYICGYVQIFIHTYTYIYIYMYIYAQACVSEVTNNNLCDDNDDVYSMNYKRRILKTRYGPAKKA